MKNWFAQLTPNEQRLLRWGGLVVGLVLLWILVLKPTHAMITKMQQTEHRLTQELQEMQKMATQLGLNTTAAVQTVPNHLTFSAWVDQELTNLQLQQLVNRAEPVDNNTLVLWLQNVPFDPVIDWLQKLENQYAIQVDQLDVQLTDRSTGLTQIRMRLLKP